MAWSPTRAALIRALCLPVADDATNWPDASLEGYWDTAFYELKKKLCPPFSTTDFNALNNTNTNAPEANRLIALQAALLIYEILPGKTTSVVQRLTDKLNQQIEDLQSGDSTLFDSSGTALTTLNLLTHTMADRQPTFSTTEKDLSGNILSEGSLDQFDN